MALTYPETMALYNVLQQTQSGAMTGLLESQKDISALMKLLPKRPSEYEKARTEYFKTKTLVPEKPKIKITDKSYPELRSAVNTFTTEYKQKYKELETFKKNYKDIYAIDFDPAILQSQAEQWQEMLPKERETQEAQQLMGIQINKLIREVEKAEERKDKALTEFEKRTGRKFYTEEKLKKTKEEVLDFSEEEVPDFLQDLLP